jgi:small subunit ribosomal protein S2
MVIDAVTATSPMSEAEQSAYMKRMFDVGAQYGATRTRRHPTMALYIFGVKNRTEVFDLEKTSALLHRAKAYMEQLGREGKVVLFVGGKREAIEAVRLTAEGLNMPYVAGRWLGGTLTNYSEIKKRIARLIELRSQRESGELEKKYTKKERLLIDREIGRLEDAFGGVVSLTAIPQALVVVDTKQEAIVVKEGNAAKIPVFGIMGSDCSLEGVTMPVVGNDATKASIAFFLNELADSYRKGKGA